MLRLLFGLVLIFSIASCASLSQKKLPSREISGEWRFDKLSWDNGASPLWFVFDVFEVQGKTVLCGAYAFKRDNKFGSSSFNDLAIANSSINLNGSVLSNDLSFMRRIDVPQKGVQYGEANCVLTDRPWKEGFGDTIEPTYELTKSGSFRILD